MLNLPQKTLNTIKKYLLREQREVEEEIKRVQKSNPVTSDGLPESSEPGTDSFLAEVHTRTVALGGELKKMAQGVKRALSKFKNGTYGHCERCGNHIETPRLLAMPTAKLCLKCSKKVTKP